MKNLKIPNNLKISKIFWWMIYISLLGVMLKHTAWVVNSFQDSSNNEGILPISYTFALVFEGALLGFTYKLKEQIESASKLRKKKNSIELLRIFSFSKQDEQTESDFSLWLRKFSKSYVNIYSFGLLICSFVSGLTNFTFAVEFGNTSLKAVTVYGVNIMVYYIALGWILPIISFLFSRVLADTSQSEEIHEDERITELKDKIKQLEEDKKALINTQYGLENLMCFVQKGEPKDIILNIYNKHPNLSKSSIAYFAKVSPAYVGEILKQMNGKK